MNCSLLDEILDTDRAFLVTVLETEGHTYSKKGAKVLFELGEDVPRFGNLGSQCVDRDLVVWGATVVQSGQSVCKTIDLSRGDDAVLGYGAYCGGRVEVLIERVDDADRAVYASLLDTLSQGKPARLVHELGPGVLRIESPHSGGRCFLAVTEPGVIEEDWEPQQQVILFGATSLADYLLAQLHSLDFEPLVVDWRQAYLGKVDPCVPSRLIERSGFIDLFPRDAYVLVLSHVFEPDRDALSAALASRCQFVGMLGSRPRRERIFSALLDQGVESELIQNIRCPLGLEIQSRSDPEIAISILAELIRFRSQTKDIGLIPMELDPE